MAKLFNYEVTGQSVLVELASVAESLDATVQVGYSRKLAAEALIMSGGFRAIKLTEGMIEELAKAKLEIENYRPGPMVCVTEEFLREFTVAEQDAIILHEIGHIVSGHHEVKDVVVNEYGVVANQNFELEADRFASAHGYGLHLASALRKMIGAMNSVRQQVNCFLPEEDRMPELTGNENLSSRIAALEN